MARKNTSRKSDRASLPVQEESASSRHSPYEPPVSVDKVAFVVAEGNAERGAGG